MRLLRVVAIVFALGAWAFGPSAAAQTAPSYQSSNPSKGEMLDHPPSEVTITFDQPLDESSWVNVLDECGNEIDAGPATVELNELRVGIAKTPAGTYEVVYKAVGLAGATGSSGSSFEFMVHHGKPCSGTKKHDHDRRKKDHGDHERDHDRDHENDHGDDGMDHTGHGTMPMGPGGHSGHSMGNPDQTGGHQGDHGTGHGRHGEGGPRGSAGGATNPPLATGPDALPVSADGQAVLVGLGLALAVGVLGGWLLRLTGTPA
ncbi:MAG TPA: copper resistance protein CopC [Actinomycetota bacterium]|nr:copper resistance protein CopC [Actinomycetota bacterium]